ncbi:MAG: hypothetical protein AAB727_03285, partial [Patescibacteria group bacterium]
CMRPCLRKQEAGPHTRGRYTGNLYKKIARSETLAIVPIKGKDIVVVPYRSSPLVLTSNDTIWADSFDRTSPVSGFFSVSSLKTGLTFLTCRNSTGFPLPFLTTMRSPRLQGMLGEETETM